MQTDFREIDALLKQYDVMDTPYYTVYQCKDYKFDWMEDDLEGGKDYLAKQLEAIKYFGNTSQFKICFYRKLTDKGTFNIENIKGSNTFKVISEDDPERGTYWAKKNGMDNPEIRQLRELVEAQQSQINALLTASDQEEEEEDKGVLGGLLNGLTPILQNQQVQQVIAGKIIGFIEKILPDTKNLTMQSLGALHGTTQPSVPIEESEEVQQQKLNDALIKLFSAGVTVNDLVKLSEMADNPTQFNFLLSMLRK